METLIKNVGCVIKDLQTVKHPTIEDAWGVRVVFTCNGCKEDYHIDEYEKGVGEAFLESLSQGKPNRNVYCVKCNSHIN